LTPKRVRLRYWVIDFRQFTFWFSAAFVAGAGPNLAAIGGVRALVGMSLVATVIGFGLWLHNRRKVGIGIYVHFARPGDGPDSVAVLKSVRRLMEKHHQDWFRTGPDRFGERLPQRVDGMFASIRHRLDEVESWASGIPPLFLYVHCRHDEAFCLGQRVAPSWGLTGRGYDIHDSDGWVLPAIDCQVRAVSRYSPESREAGELYRLDLARALTTGHRRDLVEVESKALISRQDGATNRLAIIVHAAAPEGWQAFVTGAVEAAAGRLTSGYLVDDEDLCDNALVFSVPISPLVAALRGDTAADFVGAIRDHWLHFAAQLYGTPEVPVRVFMQAPSILAFAFGVMFPPGSRLVPWVGTPAVESNGEGSAAEVVAIVDGDDVGVGMERELLSRNLTTAVEYSAQMEADMVALTRNLRSVAGVRLMSTGGDSAIFTLPRSSVMLFEQSLSRSRAELGYRFSCGYGTDSREAFVALRAAKTTGKNVTVGWL